jgi:hypothetical protein
MEDSTNLDPWIRQVRWSLQYDSFLGGGGHSRDLQQFILLEEENDFEYDEEGEGENDDTEWIVQGVPQRPLYKELALRLFRWSRRCYPKWTLMDNNGGDARLLMPAELLGFQELESLASLPPPPKTYRDIRQWIWQTSDLGILRLLGMRQSIGSDPRPFVVPSRGSLLQAAEQIHRPNSTSVLTVAARARTKHAHRGQDRFFGIAKGSSQKHNQETREILHRLLDKAVWINIHTFGGLQGDLVVEIREERGYGARWFLRPECQNTNLQFRGFLEPQMEDGHETGWRH